MTSSNHAPNVMTGATNAVTIAAIESETPRWR
jgi:hypothetical protein